MTNYYHFDDQEKKVLCDIPSPLLVMQISHDGFRLLLISRGVEKFFHIPHDQAENFIIRFNENPKRVIHQDDLIYLYKASQHLEMHPEKFFKAIIRLAPEHFKETYVNVCGDFQMRGHTKLLFLHLSDITKQHQSLITASQTSDHLSMLLNRILFTTQTCIFWKDTQRRFLGANKAFLDYYGFAGLEVILGKTDEEMGWHINPDPFKNDELRVIQNGESTYRVHGTCIVKGKVRDIVASKSPLYLNGVIVGLVGSFEDVTADYQQREEINQLNQALVRSLKNEEQANKAKADFMARMSHDMRTPLTTVMGLSEQGIEGADSERDRQLFDQIRAASGYLLSLLNDILDVEKFDAGKMRKYDEVFDLNKLHEQVLNMVSPNALKKRQQLTFTPSPIPHQPYMFSDCRWLAQILINLIDNAIKYTPLDGQVSWQVRYQDQHDGRVMVTYTIADTGVGMSEEFMRHMYEPFSQAMNTESRYATSTGLGLSIVKSAIELFGGDIDCQSKLGQGTTFTVNLPLDYASVNQVEAFHRKAISVDDHLEDLKGKHLLLCEDVAINAGIIINILEKYGMSCDHAGNGQEGLEMLAHHHYDAILMDIRMPVMDGLTAARTIRETNQDIPIIALSANTYKEDIEKSLEAGMNAHIGKPIDKRELLETILTCTS